MLTEAAFLKILTENIPDFRERKFLLALSGGADSMVLAKLFLVAGISYEAAHVNYGLRGYDSDLDEKTVADFCKKNDIELHLYQVSEREKSGKSVQTWARDLRYKFFFKILANRKLDFVVTAHHLNDELETFLINLSRGSGIRGLCGIPKNENSIFRPLLDFSKKEIYEFAAATKTDFREDLSNRKNEYLRNKFRNEVIPYMENAAPDFLRNFKNSVEYLAEAGDFLRDEIEAAFTFIFIKNDDGVIIVDRGKLLSLKPFLIREIVLKLGFRRDEIPKVVSAENGKMFRSKTHEVFIFKNELVCKPRRQISD